jgi:hypothetical protein
MMRSRPRVQIQLPVGGWQLCFQAQAESRTLIEVTDARGSLVGLVLSGEHEAPPSIGEAWHGHVCAASGCRQWWALAVGHASADEGQMAVTFTRRMRRTSNSGLEAVDGLWLVHDGLWVAATAGRYTHVRLTTRSDTQMRRLQQLAKVVLAG